MNRLLISLFCLFLLSACGEPEPSADGTDSSGEQTSTDGSSGTDDTNTDTDTTEDTDTSEDDTQTDTEEDSTGSDDSDGDDSSSEPVDYSIDVSLQAPTSLVAVVADQQVLLRWNKTPNAVAYAVYYSTEEITASSELSSLLLAVDDLEETSYTSPAAYLENGVTYYAAVVAQTSLDATTVSSFSPIKTFVPMDNGIDVTDFAQMRELNDTGSKFAVSSDTHQEACEGGDLLPEGQDCSFGRDVDDIASGDDDGLAGFSFSKVGSDGSILTADSEDWNCVLDHVTGLMWEVKDSSDSASGSAFSGSLHDADDSFTWYEPDLSGSGVTEGEDSNTSNPDSCFGYDGADGLCNTSAFRERVNAEGLCGFNDWRLPTTKELMSLVYYGNSFARRTTFAIDTNFFPFTSDTLVDSYWTSSPFYEVGNSSRAWRVYLRDTASSGQELGLLDGLSKGSSLGVMLVRTDDE
ncbi:DUF1566 domain-containing protein [Marinomonas ostreistagni]|uniref:DUF1566 domain-containing protein n=1 Tax=Marinomonas ostreistagni TaxID=359209 RepID=A0ABS0ZB75_9GAMM|nr:DUF1566 domain-containing protein [Marinomonas ostreistagni]MBJ7550916.1 DUF1566 domain-containing protein [Marinomonas ostreistagni]